MSYFNDLMNTNGVQQLRKESSTFNNAYYFWRQNLYERSARLFKWTNTGNDLNGGISPKHIESTLLINGHTGIAKDDSGLLTAFYGNYWGVGRYYDDFPNYTVRSPKFTKSFVVGSDIVVIDNNSTRNSINHLVHRYAVMLAHTEITLINTLINARDCGSVPTAMTSKEKQVIEAYRNGLCNGKLGVILDPGFRTVKWVDTSRNIAINIKDLWEVRENLLQSFYSDIGVRVAKEKKGNLIADEVSGNDSMLLLNLDDMLECRKIGCEMVNKMFGLNWSVDKAEELKYNEMNVERGEADDD